MMIGGAVLLGAGVGAPILGTTMAAMGSSLFAASALVQAGPVAGITGLVALTSGGISLFPGKRSAKTHQQQVDGEPLDARKGFDL